MPLLRHTATLAALFALLVAGSPLLSSAKSGTGALTLTGTVLMERRAAIEQRLIPGIRRKLLSLTLQGAPVPEELREILRLAEASTGTGSVAAFEAAAERYFGGGSAWKEEVAGVARKPSSSFAEALARTRTYLNAIALNAETIAAMNGGRAEEIRAGASALRERAPEAESEAGRQAFIESFAAMHAELFAGETAPMLTDFRGEARALLRELPPMLSILLGPEASSRDLRALEERMGGLDTSLDLLYGEEDLPPWIARFDEVSGAILRVAPIAPLPLLKKDLMQLLENLDAYLSQLERMRVGTGDAAERLLRLRSTLPEIATDADVDAFLRELEDLLEHLGGNPIPLPSASAPPPEPRS